MGSAVNIPFTNIATIYDLYVISRLAVYTRLLLVSTRWTSSTRSLRSRLGVGTFFTP